jgi:putative superfamily III holin-X
MYAQDQRSLGDLFGELTQEISRLFRQEIALAKLELSQNVSRVGSDAALVAAGGVILHAGLLALIFTLVLVLDLALHMLWLSALIVTLVVLVAGFVLLQTGLKRLKQEDLTPRQTLETLRGDVEWAKEQTR